MSDVFRFQRSGRQLRSVAITGASIAALLLAVFVLHIHPAIAVVFAVLIAPAAWDVFRNTQSELTLSDTALTWRMGARGMSFALDEVERVNTKLSLDFSQKASVLTKAGKTHRIPPPCVPQDGSLDAALTDRGVAVERSLF